MIRQTLSVCADHAIGSMIKNILILKVLKVEKESEEQGYCFENNASFFWRGWRFVGGFGFRP